MNFARAAALINVEGGTLLAGRCAIPSALTWGVASVLPAARAGCAGSCTKSATAKSHRKGLNLGANDMLNLRSRLTRNLQRWREYRALLLFLLLMLGFRSAWADWVTVPSGSMNPTILEGDRVLIDKHVFGLRVPFSLIRLSRGVDPARGDIVVFDSPVNGQSLVKRVAAVPGDTLELDGERLIINGQSARYRTGDLSHLRQLLGTTAAEGPAVLTEEVAGREHEILILPARSSRRLFGPVTVPAGMYFMLGDNRDNSADSRYIGFVPRRRIVGRASRVVLSFDPEHHFLPRWNRLLLPLT